MSSFGPSVVAPATEEGSSSFFWWRKRNCFCFLLRCCDQGKHFYARNPGYGISLRGPVYNFDPRSSQFFILFAYDRNCHLFALNVNLYLSRVSYATFRGTQHICRFRNSFPVFSFFYICITFLQSFLI